MSKKIKENIELNVYYGGNVDVIQKCILTTIIPVFNVEKYLRNTLESLVAQQGFDSVEVLLIDDGSTDNSGLICDEYTAKYDNITTYHIKNSGVSHARNFGIKKAKGNYIHFLDSDDELCINMYKEFLKVCVDKSPDVLIGGVEYVNLIKGSNFDVGPSSTQLYSGMQEINFFLRNLDSKNERWVTDYVWNKFYRKDVIIENNIQFTESISKGEDFEFNCKFLCKVSNIYTSKSIVYKYYIRNTGLANAFHADPHIRRERLYKLHLNLYNTWDCLTDERVDSIKKFHGMLAFSSLRSINSTKCKLSKEEKRVYIENIINSSQFDNILYYCKTDGRLKQKVFYLMLKRKNTILVKLLIYFDKINRLKEKLKI